VLGLLIISIGGVNALASDYPERPIKMIVAYSPGGGTDVAARTIAQYLKPYLGQSVAVENRTGAGGQIGFTVLSNAPSNGYTIGFVNVPVILMIPALRPSCTYNINDFELIANIVLDPLVLAVQSESPFKSLSDLVEYARANPKKIVIGMDGPQSNNRLQAMVAEEVLGIEFTYVYYDGAAPAITACLGKHVDLTLPSAGEAVPFEESGQMRVLTIFWPERVPMLADVSTFQELTGMEIPPVGASARGIAAPKDVPADRLKILEEALEKVTKSPDFLAKAEEIGLPINFMNASDFKKHIISTQKELEKYLPMMK